MSQVTSGDCHRCKKGALLYHIKITKSTGEVIEYDVCFPCREYIKEVIERNRKRVK